MLFFRKLGVWSVSELFFFGRIYSLFWFLAFHQTRCVSSAALGISHFSSHWFTPLCEGTTWHRYQSVSWHCCRHPLFGLAFCKLCYTLVFLFYLAANGVWDDLFLFRVRFRATFGRFNLSLYGSISLPFQYSFSMLFGVWSWYMA